MTNDLAINPHATEFQKNVMSGVGETVSDKIKALAYSAEMDRIVDEIGKLFILVSERKKNDVLGFSVRHNGECWNVNEHRFDYLDINHDISKYVHGNLSQLMALKYRGSQEGFRVAHRYRGVYGYLLRNPVILFIPPSTE